MTQFLSDLGVIPTSAPQSLQFDQWVDDLLETPGTSGVPNLLTEPAATAVYLNGVRNTIIAGTTLKPLVRIADCNLENFWELDGEISGSAEELMEDTGKLTITVSWQNWVQQLLVEDIQLTEDVNILVDWDPLNPGWRTRWGGKITEIHIKKDEKGVHSIELTALHFREHAKRLLVAANPIFAPEVQIPRMWVLPGPCRTICAVTSFINLARLFMPGLSTITNVFNPAGWINPLNVDAAANVLPTAWPIQVAFVDIALDQSRWTSIGATWTTWQDSYKDILVNSGCMMQAYTYLLTDADSPNTELASLLELAPELIAGITGIDLDNLENDTTTMAAPLRNCVVFSFEDVSGVTGPTGTLADGLLDTVAVTLDDLITPVTIDLNTGNTYDPGQVLNGETVEDASGVGQTYLLEQLLGVAPAPPQVIWWDGTYNGMLTTDITYHKGAVTTLMTGSKSPVIVNEAQTFAIRYGLSQLQTVITGGVFEETGAAPIGAGLDNLYQGQLDNVLLAWERFTDPIRALYSGDMAWQEHFERGSGTAYTLSSILTLQSADWKTRAWASFQAQAVDGFPWIADYDYFLGDRVGFEQDGVIYVDNVYGIKHEWDWQKPLDVTCKIGEGRDKQDPFGAAFKTIANLYALVGEIAGEGTVFDGS
jgi:hypothetical protein